MVTIKRYIGKVKKPLHWRGRRHFLRNVVLPSVTAVLLLLAVRTLLLTQFSLSDNLPASGLLEGDRILVDRTAYGVRNPLAGFFGADRWGRGVPQYGETAVWTETQGAGGMRLGRITALPGDTVTCGTQRYVLAAGTNAAGTDIIIHSQLVGRIVCVTYSIDARAPFYNCLRSGRMFVKPSATGGQ